MKQHVLPNRHKCEIDDKKIIDYLLNLQHRDGGPKAKFFIRFGFSIICWRNLCVALKQHAVNNLVVEMVESEYGKKYVVTCEIATPDGRNPCINTVWIVVDEAFPRLIAAYPEAAG